MFEEFLEESYILFNKKDENLIANIVTTNLSKKFKEMINKNKTIILMSGTLHSKEVLNGIFGLENFKLIQAEDQSPGEIFVMETGMEMDCKYSNFSSGKYTRKEYLKALDFCLEKAKKPTLAHINSFQDLPSKQEIYELKLNNLISAEELIYEQNNDKEGRAIENFKNGHKKILFSTRASRGVDFPGEQCNSIIFTKYPNPNVQDPFWKILSRTKPNQYWNFYKDKARRELLQQAYRGLRFKEDKIEIWSPDLRVLEFFK
jgi:Rad3-related DNA helicase